MKNNVTKYLLIVLACLALICLGAFFDVVPKYLEYREIKKDFTVLSGRVGKLEKNYENMQEEYENLKLEYDEKKNSSVGMLTLIKRAYDGRHWESVLSLAAEFNRKFAKSDEYDKVQQYKKIAEKYYRLEEEKREREKYETGLTYENIALESDKNKGTYCTFSGRVLQSIESGSNGWLRLAVDNDTQQVLFASFQMTMTDSRIYADETVRLYGKADGLFTYKTADGKEITIPKISVDMIGRS